MSIGTIRGKLAHHVTFGTGNSSGPKSRISPEGLSRLPVKIHRYPTGGVKVKKLIVFVFLSILLIYPAISGAADDTLDAGKSSLFSYPIFNIPIGSDGSNPNAPAKEDKGEDQAKIAEKKRQERAMLDKKVDDAIKKAWEDK